MSVPASGGEGGFSSSLQRREMSKKGGGVQRSREGADSDSGYGLLGRRPLGRSTSPILSGFLTPRP